MPPTITPLNVEDLNCSLQELERRIGADRQVASYYCTSNISANPDDPNAS
jgi:hypothetical protein